MNPYAAQARDIAREIRRATVTLRWVERATPAVPDPVTGTDTAAGTVRTRVVPGLFKLVRAARGEVRRWAELQAGDAVIYFLPGEAVDALEQLEIEAAGRVWRPKRLGTQQQTSQASVAAGLGYYRMLPVELS